MVRAGCHVGAMPTSAERKALLFLAGVIVLGASVRVVRAARHDRRPDVATRQALSRQLAAVDSASECDGSIVGGPRDEGDRCPQASRAACSARHERFVERVASRRTRSRVATGARLVTVAPATRRSRCRVRTGNRTAPADRARACPTHRRRPCRERFLRFARRVGAGARSRTGARRVPGVQGDVFRHGAS